MRDRCLNRRSALAAGVTGLTSLSGLWYFSGPVLAAEGLTVNNPAEVDSSDGTLSSLEVPSSGCDFTVEWSDFGSGSHTISVSFEAKLADSDSYDVVFSEDLTGEGDSGELTDADLSQSFPLDLLAETSMRASDFEVPSGESSAVNPVDVKLSFSSNLDSQSISNQFDVAVNETGEVLESFDSDLSAYAGNTGYFSTVDSPSYSGKSLEGAISSGGAAITTLDISTQQGETYEWRYKNKKLGFVCGVQSETGTGNLSGYLFTVNAGADVIRIYRADSGSYSKIAQNNGGFSLSGSEWNRVKVEWGSSGDLVLTVYDSNGNEVASTSANNTQYSSGGVGWRQYSRTGNADELKRI
jgi:hypothetical protein